MADETIGTLGIQIEADASDLPGQFDAAAAAAQTAGNQIGTAFSGGALQGTQQLSDGIGDLAGVFRGLQALGVVSTIEQIGSASLEAYGSLERATMALTALTGSVTQANNEIAGLRTLAQDDALSFPELVNANQRFTALGISAAQIPNALRAAADAAAAMNTSLTTTSNAMERIASSGTLSSRVLVQLGINLQDVASAMGVSSADVVKDFKAITDESQRLSILTDAMGKLSGTAAAVADGVTASFTRVQNTITTTMQGVGESIAPAAKDLADLAQVTIPALGQAASSLGAPLVSIVQFGKALVDAKSQIQTLIESLSPFAGVMETVGKEAKDSGDSFLSYLSPGVSLVTDGITTLTNRIEGFVNEGTNADFMTKQMTDNLNKLSSAARVGGQAFVDAFKGSGASVQAINDITTAQTKANTELHAAETAYDRLNTMYQTNTKLANGQAVSQGDVARALENLHQKQDALNNLNPVFADTIGGITKAYNEQNQQIAALERTQADLLSIQDRSADQQAKLNQVSNDLAKAYKAQADAIGNIKTQIADLPKAYDGLVTSADAFAKKERDVGDAVGYAKSVLDQAIQSNDGSAQSQRVVTDALNQYIDKLKASGAAMTDQITLNIHGVDVVTTLGNAINMIKQSQGDWNTATINGVQVLKDHAAAAITTSAAVQGLGTIIQNSGIDALKAIGYFNPLSASVNDVGTAAGGAVDNSSRFATQISTASDDASGAVDNMSRFANSIDHVGESSVTAAGKLGNLDNAITKAGASAGKTQAASKGAGDQFAQTAGDAEQATEAFGATTASVDALSTALQFLAFYAAPAMAALSGTGSAHDTINSHFVSALDQISQLNQQQAQAQTGGAALQQQLQQEIDTWFDAQQKQATALATNTTATNTNTTAVTNKATATTIAASATDTLTSATSALSDAVSTASTATSATAAIQQSFVDGLGNVYNSYQALVDAIRNNPLLAGPAVSQSGSGVAGSGPSSAPAQTFVDGMGNVYSSLQALQQALAANPGLAGPHQASGPLQNITPASGGSTNQIFTVGGQQVSLAQFLDSLGSTGSFSGGASAGTSPTSGGFGLPSSVLSNQPGITINMHYPQFNTQQQTQQVTSQLVAQLRTITGIKI